MDKRPWVNVHGPVIGSMMAAARMVRCTTASSVPPRPITTTAPRSRSAVPGCARCWPPWCCGRGGRCRPRCWWGGLGRRDAAGLGGGAADPGRPAAPDHRRGEVGSGPAGYWLTAPGSDLADFQRLADEGRRALDARQYETAADRLRAAGALWRGPALADLPDRLSGAVRLETERKEARRQRIAAELELGRAAEVAAELAGLCAERPLDEPLHVLWLRALHRSGRTAEALSRYDTIRRALADRLGADPGAQLAALHQELLQCEAPSPPAAPARPAAPGNAHPTAHANAQGNAHPTAHPNAQGNLRARLTSFVGREQDLEALRGLVGQARLVTLTGPGGSGKTRLSVEAGRLAQAAGSWPQGVWLAELAPLEEPSAIPAAVFSALGLRATQLSQSRAAEAVEGRTEDPLQRIIEHCGHGRMLLILDNCEHLIQDVAEFTDQLLSECPELTVLATSREPLGVPGEAVLPVEPLPDPIALRLLAERGAAARAGFDPADDPAASAEICRRLDGLPLAIELAAARLRSMTPRQLADRLDGRFALLTGGGRTLLPRQRTLRAVVDWSWELLDGRECAVLARLSVFAGGWSLEDAAEVCADGAGLRPGEVADLIFSLVDKSLLVAALNPDGPPRYRMLETIHEYAAERLAEAAEAEPEPRCATCAASASWSAPRTSGCTGRASWSCSRCWSASRTTSGPRCAGPLSSARSRRHWSWPWV